VVIEGGLDQPDAREVARSEMIERGLHQAAADPLLLNLGIDGDRPDAGDRRALIGEITTNDPAIAFRHDAVKCRVGERPRHRSGRDLDRGVRAREIVMIVERLESAVGDLAACPRIRGFGASNRNGHRFLHCRFTRLVRPLVYSTLLSDPVLRLTTVNDPK
jgi:hypothetical protein